MTDLRIDSLFTSESVKNEYPVRGTFLFMLWLFRHFNPNNLSCSYCSWTAITQLAHHGMLYVPIGYTFGAGMFKMDSLRGGSPYGAGVFSGDGSREPSETELALGEHQGKYMAAVVKRFAHPSDSLK